MELSKIADFLKMLGEYHWNVNKQEWIIDMQFQGVGGYGPWDQTYIDEKWEYWQRDPLGFIWEQDSKRDILVSVISRKLVEYELKRKVVVIK